MKPVCKTDADGTKSWYLNGKLHREDGPAVEWKDGTKLWYLNGVYHREEGPAVEYADGDKEWYLNNKKITEELHTKLIKGPLENLPLYLGLGYDEFIAKRLKE